MSTEKRYKNGISGQREMQCREWAKNRDIIQCLKSIAIWSEEKSCDANVYENVYDWVNNILWYNNMEDVDPVFGRTKRRR